MIKRRVRTKRPLRLPLIVVFDLLTAALVVGAVVLAFLPVGNRVTSGSGDGRLPPTFDATLPLRGNMSADSIMQSMIRNNVLSSTRREPRTRFSPPGTETGGSASMSQYTPVPGTTGEVFAGGEIDGMDQNEYEQVPSLSGIVSVDGAPRALLVLRAGEAPRLFAIGDLHAGYRVQSIDRDRVILSSGGTRKTLRMRQPLRRDSLGVSQ